MCSRQKNGYIEQIGAKKLGDACILLGAGRLSKTDQLDLKVGIDLKKKLVTMSLKVMSSRQFIMAKKAIKRRLTMLKMRFSLVIKK